MKKYVIIIALALLLLSCNENRNRGVGRVMDDVRGKMEEVCNIFVFCIHNTRKSIIFASDIIKHDIKNCIPTKKVNIECIRLKLFDNACG